MTLFKVVNMSQLYKENRVLYIPEEIVFICIYIHIFYWLKSLNQTILYLNKYLPYVGAVAIKIS